MRLFRHLLLCALIAGTTGRAAAAEFTREQRLTLRAAALTLSAEIIQCVLARDEKDDRAEVRLFCDRLQFSPDARMLELLDCPVADDDCMRPKFRR